MHRASLLYNVRDRDFYFIRVKYMSNSMWMLNVSLKLFGMFVISDRKVAHCIIRKTWSSGIHMPIGNSNTYFSNSVVSSIRYKDKAINDNLSEVGQCRNYFL